VKSKEQLTGFLTEKSKENRDPVKKLEELKSFLEELTDTLRREASEGVDSTSDALYWYGQAWIDFSPWWGQNEANTRMQLRAAAEILKTSDNIPAGVVAHYALAKALWAFLRGIFSIKMRIKEAGQHLKKEHPKALKKLSKLIPGDLTIPERDRIQTPADREKFEAAPQTFWQGVKDAPFFETIASEFWIQFTELKLTFEELEPLISKDENLTQRLEKFEANLKANLKALGEEMNDKIEPKEKEKYVTLTALATEYGCNERTLRDKLYLLGVKPDSGTGEYPLNTTLAILREGGKNIKNVRAAADEKRRKEKAAAAKAKRKPTAASRKKKPDRK